ncbi:MAG TPA: hypothetical protein VMV62_00870 [Candidatus Paceibacterota bacterium]|nr:hypothetical protein [Candidatus Paceibacterota bacterium]
MRDKIIFAGVAVIAVIVGALVFVSGRGTVSNGSPAATGYSNETATAVPFTKLVQGTTSAVSDRTNYLITSPSQLSELWKMIDAHGTPPTVDFATHAVLAVFAGKQPSASIAVAKIEDANERLVSIIIAKPASACAPQAVADSPYELVAVATTSLPLAHQDISTTASCPN